jgi:hypothetical protein
MSNVLLLGLWPHPLGLDLRQSHSRHLAALGLALATAKVDGCTIKDIGKGNIKIVNAAAW